MDNDSDKEIELFLSRMKMLIQKGQNYRHFVHRKSRNVRADLIELGFSSSIEIWQSLLELTRKDLYKPPEPDHNGSGELIYFFMKSMPNGVNAYVKVKIKSTDTGELCVCLSFHPAEY
ncbi:hypothetical protein RB620_24500 [Paenibacillus sp. LHD-117]|uniref:hypothetical protein n=1 Tax=Paenibacillus sp. LHD-117 TaxID=3071412 RepID=UPI0027E1225B|nr:hypothetical protein [Paenibacillus sp. LHD-117]MDQ6422597.1 hypothetical protein [Paenibacillus sp. LHD-117]